MKILTKADILAAKDLEAEPVEVKEWGGEVLIKRLSGVEAEVARGLIKQHQRGDDLKDAFALMAKILAMTIVNEDGSFTFEGEEDIVALQDKCSAVLSFLFEEAMKLNSLAKDASEQAEKN